MSISCNVGGNWKAVAHSNTKTYGSVAYTDAIAADATLTKQIVAGSGFSHGIVIICLTGTPFMGIMVFIETDNTKSKVTGLCYETTYYWGSAWHRTGIGMITYVSTGPGAGVIGNVKLHIHECYINGSNIDITFHNSDAVNPQSLACTVYWEVWE